MKSLEVVIASYIKYVSAKLAWFELHYRQYKKNYLPAYWKFLMRFETVPARVKGREFEYFHNFQTQATLFLLSYELYVIRYKVFLDDFRQFAASVQELWRLISLY